MKDAAGGVLPAVGTPLSDIPMPGGGAGSGWASAVDVARPGEEKGKISLVDKERNIPKKLTLSIALLVRASLDPLFSFLALGINALFANAVLDAAQAGARVIALLACLLTIGAGIFDLATLGTNLGLGVADHTRSERVHVHGQASIGSRMDSQLRLNRVRGGLGGLIDSAVVRVGADRSHAWEGGGEGMSERMSGGCGGREEEMKGSGLQKFGPAAKARGNNWRLNSKTQKEGRQAPGKGTWEKGNEEKQKMRTGRH
jgi:hypothetical protein